VAKQLLIGKDNYFRCAVDVADFSREEIKVSTLGHTLSIEAAHQEKDDGHGSITRQFSKKYVLPFDMDVGQASAFVSDKKILYVKIPPKQKPDALVEKFVEIKLEDK
jgi:crystallin alpha B